MRRSRFVVTLATLLLLNVSGVLVGQSAGADRLIASKKVAVVETESGKVQGFIHTGTFTFRGIPYAKAERFMPPTKAPKWQGTRTALTYGFICPQAVPQRIDDVATFVSGHRYWLADDNCQNLNIWTPGINDKKKRPVMVWLHGGGFTNGSSIELPIYDGDNLSKKGDVVVVTINHRLNVLGFLDLSAYGDKYKYSANTSIMDIVAALQWVKDNIANFGGDPGNVTIFGQSGGGGKVITLLATPAAKGLFQKAVVESGTFGKSPPFMDQKKSRRVAELTLQNAGLDKSQLDQLQQIPYVKLDEASEKALRMAAAEFGTVGLFGPSMMWTPVMDGDYLPHQSLPVEAPPESKDVLLMIGSTLDEFGALNPKTQGKDDWSADQVKAYFKELYADKADLVFASFQKTYPRLKPNEWVPIDSMARIGVLASAQMKADQGGAAVYTYLFTWQSPVMDHFWRAGHSEELPFVFDNAELGEQSTGGGKAVYKLTDEVSQAWINFARTGNPSQTGLVWPAYTSNGGATMIFDDPCEVRYHHDKDLISLEVPK